MENHFVICGWSSVGKVALSELTHEEFKVAVITDNPAYEAEIKSYSPENIKVVLGDPSSDQSLNQAEISKCWNVIICTGDDTKNLIAALNTKKYNPNARIIASIQRQELKKTLKVAGVTFVASPNELAGRLIASASFEPDVARFVEQVTTSMGGYDIQQYSILEGSPFLNQDVKFTKEKLKDLSEALLIAIAKYRDGNWDLVPNPEYNELIEENDIIIILGSDTENEKAERYLGISQGR